MNIENGYYWCEVQHETGWIPDILRFIKGRGFMADDRWETFGGRSPPSHAIRLLSDQPLTPPKPHCSGDIDMQFEDRRLGVAQFMARQMELTWTGLADTERTAFLHTAGHAIRSLDAILHARDADALKEDTTVLEI